MYAPYRNNPYRQTINGYKRDYSTLKKHIDKSLRYIIPAVLIGAVVLLIGWSVYRAHSIQEEKAKECGQYRDIAMRDVPARCVRYWERHDY